MLVAMSSKGLPAAVTKPLRVICIFQPDRTYGRHRESSKRPAGVGSQAHKAIVLASGLDRITASRRPESIGSRYAYDRSDADHPLVELDLEPYRLISVF